VKSMPLEFLRWMVFAVVVYTAAVMFRASLAGRREERAQASTKVVTAR
jgi:hypothetical protein